MVTMSHIVDDKNDHDDLDDDTGDEHSEACQANHNGNFFSVSINSTSSATKAKIVKRVRTMT